jgi:uncharacterized protein (TIGR04255 family)
MALPFKIDLQEQFPHLSRAPVVEAVLDIRARPEVEWLEQSVTDRLKNLLPDYPHADRQREFTQQQIFGETSAKFQDKGWTGVRLMSAHAENIAEFTRDGFAYHRLPPYQNWTQFSGEAMRLWRHFLEIAQPGELQRIGVRFIGRIEMEPEEGNFEEYIQPSPTTPRGIELPFLGFFHQDTLGVPGYPYVVNIIRTIQLPQKPTQGCAIILDIDVGTDQPFKPSEEEMARCLAEMRWLKNRVFFGSIAEKTLEKYK